MNNEVSQFIYSIDNIGKIKKSLSADRLLRYEKEVDMDAEAALRLYVWNTEISAAFYAPLQGLEVTLRNALHTQLAHKYQRDSWYDKAPLDEKSLSDVLKAKEKVKILHQGVKEPHVVAELSFGFWQSLLSRKYHGKLWTPALHKAFPHARLKYSKIHTTLEHLRLLRNRIAHHEPIFHRHLANDYKSILNVLGWICPETQHWIQQHSAVNETLSKRLHLISKDCSQGAETHAQG